ncbi:MAG: hypothetical protein IIB00_10315, partial [candidate division Zixibacteria bacterium]|nr:hypothetical protein [candidate division Zixibacteria bacterium]
MSRISMSAVVTVIVIVFALVSAPLPIQASAPQLVNYQGLLTDGAGDPLDTTVNITFTIYDDPSAGSAIWTEIQTSVAVVAGQFNILLGSVTTLVDTVFNDTTRYLGIQVGGDAELTPRSRIVTAPYSFRSSRAVYSDTADFADTAALAVLAKIAELAIFADSTEAITDGAVDMADIGRSEEQTSELQPQEELVCRLLLEK